MPGKSRSKKGKYSSLAKKGKSRSNHSATPLRQPSAGQIAQPEQAGSSPRVPAIPASAPVPKTEIGAGQYRYVAAELRTIGILVGILLVALFVLASILR